MKKKLKKVLKTTKEQLLKERIKELESEVELENNRANYNYTLYQKLELELSELKLKRTTKDYMYEQEERKIIDNDLAYMRGKFEGYTQAHKLELGIQEDERVNVEVLNTYQR